MVGTKNLVSLFLHFGEMACYLCGKLYIYMTMKEKFGAFEADMEGMFRTLQERVKRFHEESESELMDRDSELVGLHARLNRLSCDYSKQLAVNKALTMEMNTMRKHMAMLKGELEQAKVMEAASSGVRDEAEDLAALAEVKQRTYSEVIGKLIAEAEQYPSNQNDKAEAIKGAIQSLMLAESVQLPAELRSRLQRLGRKETTMARAMVEVTGNDKVIFGGQGNG